MSDTRPRPAGDPSLLRSESRYFVEILAVCGMAVAQPVLSAFGSSPEHLAFRGVSSADLVVFALAVVLVPPIVVAGVAALIGHLLGDRRPLVHAIALAVVFAFAVVQIGWRVLSLSGLALALMAIVGGIGFAALYRAWEPLRLWTAYAALVPAAALASFLFLSPASDLVLAPSVDAADLSLDDTPPIVVLVLDELPTSTLLDVDGEIDASLFPGFAALAEQSTWYRNASTVSNYTTWAVPGLLTGLVPEADALATLGDHPRNLFTLLAGSYDIRADEAPSQLCPSDLCLGVAAPGGGLTQLLADARRLWRAQVSVDDPGSETFDLVEEVATLSARPTQFEDEDERLAADIREFQRLVTTSPTRFTSFLEAIRPSPRPTLNYLHIQVPHSPWRYYPSGTEYVLDTNEPAGQGAGTWSAAAAGVVGRQRHILQAQYGDALVGQLLAHLGEQGMLDETLLVVVADHGLSFGEGEAIRADEGDAFPGAQTGDVWWVPLFIKEPEQTDGRRSDLPIELIDVVPTIVDVLETDPGWEFDGTSAAELAPDDEVRTLCRRIRLDGFATDAVCSAIDGSAVVDTLVAKGTGSFLSRVENDQWRVYRAGPHGDLVGLEVDSIEAVPTSGGVEIEHLDRFTGVSAGGPLPGLVAGRLADGRVGVPVAVVLNETIAVTTTSFDAGDETGVVSAIIPDFVFRDGENRLGLYEIVGSSDGTALAPLELVG